MLDLATVRAYVQVPATTLSDDDLARMLDTARAAQEARCAWANDSPLVLSVVDTTLDVSATGGTPEAVFRLDWGDGYGDLVELDANGDGTVSHTYADAGRYTVTAYEGEHGNNQAARFAVTVPGNGVLAAAAPAALDQALLRRVQREIAARNLPLGMVGLDSSEYGPERLPFYDALVEEHERAYRRQVLA